MKLACSPCASGVSSGYTGFLPQSNTCAVGFSTLPNCVRLCPAMGWHPIQGVPCLVPFVLWDKSQAPCNPVRVKMTTFRCRVILLDDTVVERDLEKKALGQVLFDKVCEHLNLLEKDYFGLAAWDSSNNKVWLDVSKQVHKQIIRQDATFTFSVKFYPPDPSVLAEDITRYLLCLQLRADILTSRLPCPSDVLAVLGSYTVQSEFGDYNPELHGKEFFSNIPLAPNQTPELEEKVTELHRTLRSMSPAEADQLFLQNVKTLDMYGVHLHPAKDASGADVMLGVCADGLAVYEGEEKTQTFIWPNVLNMSYKRSNFHARIIHSEDATENTIKFSLPSYRACKCLWRNAVEHHAFFRNLEEQDKVKEGLLHLGSKFRFHGSTHAESLKASSTIERPAPHFSRSGIKRKAKESYLMALKRPYQTEVDDWFQVLGSDESWPTYGPDKGELTGGETLAYKEREEVDKLDDEWFQLLGGRYFPTQHSLSSLSSDTDILESATFQLWKLQADDWFVLLKPHTYQPTFWHWKTIPSSLQSSQAEEQREELEWIERTSEMGIKDDKIRKEVEAVTERHEELEMERNLMRPDVAEENLKLDIEASEQILKVMRKKIEQEGDGEELQTVVMYEQRTQEVEPHTGQFQEFFVEQSMRGMEVVDTVHELMLKTGQVVSEENIEELEETLLEVESIEQRLEDIQRLKVRLQEVDILQQKLEEVQQARRQRGESDDWYVLLEHKLMESLAPTRILVVETSEQKLQDIEKKRQEQRQRGDWYLLLDRKPLVISSASAAEQKAEIRQWIEAELQRANTITPVQMKDDWYILLELLPQTIQPTLPPSEIDIQSSRVRVVEEHKNLGEEKEWREERVINVRETQPTLPAQREEQTQKQKDDDWFIQQDVSPKEGVYKETREEEAQLVKKEGKKIIFEEKRREMIETSHEMVQMNPIPFTPSVPMTLISEDTAGLRPHQTVKIEEKEVIFDKKPMIIRKEQVIVGEVEKKNPAIRREDEDDWFVFFSPAQFVKMAVATARGHVVEDRRLYPYVPGPKAAAYHREVIDDWFIMFEPVSKKSVSVDRRAEEDQARKEELFKKKAMAEDRRKVTGFKPPSVPVIPLTPADQPMTSTPTAQSVRITRPTYEEESLKRLDITQEITQDITQESKVETESIIKRKRREKRIEGESIYIRHSILMLEDSDVIQDVVLRHHASISELKRIFMEDMPVSGPTEWDRRLSTYIPVVYPQLSNGELFTGIDIMGADELVAV
ncbi:protein 4.1b isoform X2 [Pangasianodon hypophthalmus]|uniref:protein 4.1b isoform X2 n=1 Tax=Pangasianodon hypophthalmus TaxID=310915 RepID=UPI00230772BC|nr:protein 4.1b isoform X2 [Pangasianodon hypophthalmus]